MRLSVLLITLALTAFTAGPVFGQQSKTKTEKKSEKEKDGISSLFKKKDDTEASVNGKKDKPSRYETKDDKDLKDKHKAAKSEVKMAKKERKAAEAREKAAKARANAIKAQKKADKADEKALKTDRKLSSRKS